jgi:UTP--glucose-1-phosphate uridylyltransferase
VLEPSILGYLVENQLHFLMEVSERTEIDQKGGHVARRKKDGRLTLREIAQTPLKDKATYQDITYHRYFNCNNLWLDLQALKDKMDSTGGILGLSLIRNEKTVDPRDPDSPKVYQLETAMVSAVSIFENARAVRVPRNRLIPVKKTEDLCVARSDAFVLNQKYEISANPRRSYPMPPIVSLDERYYKMIDQLEARMPKGEPSLLECIHLVVEGDILFGEGVVCKGEVRLTSQATQQVALANVMLENETWHM